MAGQLVLDDVAKRIIEQLQEDGRRPYATIAKAVGLSEAAVRQRVQRLQEAGVIQIVAVTDPMQVGLARAAMVGICVSGDVDQVADRIAGIAEVSYLVACAGRHDLLAELVVEDDAHLRLIISSIRSMAEVTSTETFIYFALHKQTYTWGTR